MFASSLFTQNESGNCACFYCGENCSDAFSAHMWVRKTFTGYATVRRPESKFVCRSCKETLNEKATVELVDGEIRTGQRIRAYSWILRHSGKPLAATRRHIAQIRSWILNPPVAPFAIVIAVSSQKHLLYRAPVSFSREEFHVMLEEETIVVNPKLLEKRLSLCIKITAASGKPSLTDFGYSSIAALYNYYEEKIADEILTEWSNIKQEPLSRLAAYICPPREECRDVGSIDA